MSDGGRISSIPSTRWTARQTLIAALVLLALCLLVRAPINVVPPMLTTIGARLGMNEVLMGALTAVPVLCFGLLTPVGSACVKRWGPNASAAIFLVLLVAGAAIRSAGSIIALFAGTILMGFAIAIANIVIPMIIGRDFPMRAALMTGLYTVASNLGVTVVTAVAVPTAESIGWQGSALAWSAAPTILIAVAWLRVFPPIRRVDEKDPRAGCAEAPDASIRGAAGRPVWRTPTVWLLAAAFGGHTYAYYAFAGWLPTMLQDIRSMSEAGAGLAATIFHVTGIAGSLLPPFLRGTLRRRDSTVLLVVSAMWLSMPIGLLAAPGLWPIWSTLCGLGHGALFTALFTIVIEHSPTIDVNRRVVAFVQSVGYLIAAIGPVSVGWMHTLTGDWTVPFMVLTVSLTVMTVCSQLVARGRIDLGDGAADERVRAS